MLEKFKNHIQHKFSFLENKKLLIAVSGGIDSVVLTYLFKEIKASITLAHCNFKLRNTASNLDEIFVVQLAKKLEVPVCIKKFDTLKIAKTTKESTQVAARNLRYKWFRKLAKEHEFDYILTAHHADDNLETFLINLTRGSGLDGFTGIPAVNQNIVRPLLVFSREEISTFAIKNQITWREDKSNASTKYVRNNIRHKIIPVLKEINPSLLHTFSSTLKNLEESKQIVQDRVEAVSKSVVIKNNSNTKIIIQELLKLQHPKAYLYQLLKTYHFKEWNDIFGLLTAQTGKFVVSDTHILLKDRDFLILSKTEPIIKNSSILIEENQLEIKTPIHLVFCDASDQFTTDRKLIYINKSLITYPLTLRKWQSGDSFYPLGMNGKKKISKFFKDEKLSLLEKEQTWLLCTFKNEIIWVIGMRQDRRFYLKTSSKNSIIKLV